MKYLMFLLLFISLSTAIYIDSLKVIYNKEQTFANLSFFIVNDINSYKHVCLNVEGSNFIYSKSFSLKPDEDLFVSIGLKGNPYSEINENIEISIVDNCGGDEVNYRLIYPVYLNKTGAEEPFIILKKQNKPTVIIEYIDKPRYKFDNLFSFGLSFIFFASLLLFVYSRIMRDQYGF